MFHLCRFICLLVLLAGCVTTNDLSEHETEAYELNVRLSEIEPSPETNNVAQYRWVQPKNLEVDCKVLIKKELAILAASDSLALYWDGGCKSGYARGLGREFFIGSPNGDPRVNLYYLSDYYGNPGDQLARYVEHDFINGSSKEGDLIAGYYVQNFLSDRDTHTYEISPWLANIGVNSEFVGRLSFGYVEGTTVSVLTELLGFAQIRRSIKNHDGTSLEIIRNLGDSPSYQQVLSTTYFTPKLPTRNLSEIELNLPKMRFFSSLKRTLEPGTVFKRSGDASTYKPSGEAPINGTPVSDKYWRGLENIEWKIAKESEIALNERWVSLLMKSVYLESICGDKKGRIPDNGIKYNEICESIDKDEKVNRFIFNIDKIRKNKEVLAEYFIADYNDSINKFALNAPTPMLLHLVQLSVPVTVTVPEPLRKYLPKQNVPSYIYQALFANEVPTDGEVKWKDEGNAVPSWSAPSVKYDLQSPEGRAKYRNFIRSKLRDAMNSSRGSGNDGGHLEAGSGIFYFTQRIK